MDCCLPIFMKNIHAIYEKLLEPIPKTAMNGEQRFFREREENVVKDYYIDIAIVIKIMYPFAIQMQQ